MRLMGALRIIDGDKMIQQVEVDYEVNARFAESVLAGEGEIVIAVMPKGWGSWSSPEVINLDELYASLPEMEPNFVEEIGDDAR